MKTANTVNYSSHGYIFLCPECRKGDREPDLESTHVCRYCERPFKLKLVHKMDDDLYKAIQYINLLETGTVLGASPEMLRGSNFAKAAKAVGIDVISQFAPDTEQIRKDFFSKYPPKETGRFRPWRLSAEAFRHMYKEGTDYDREVIKALAKMFKQSVKEFLAEESDMGRECYEQAKFIVYMNNHKGLTREQKLDYLNTNGYQVETGEYGKEHVTVFFASTVMPECDQWVKWKD